MKQVLNFKEIKKFDKPMAIILGRYSTTGLALSRSFGRRNIPVLWLDPNNKSLGYYSKYCKCILCPNPKDFELDYIKLLFDIGQNIKQKAVLLPIFDTEVLIIAKYKKELNKYFYIQNCNFDAVEKLINKKIFYKLLEKYNIAHPKTYYPKNIDDVKKISDKILYPCFIKPVISADFVLDFRLKLFRVESKDELIKRYIEKNLKNHKVMIQEIIPGNVKNMFGFNAYYDKNCKPKNGFMYRRIREWPYYYGNGCYIEKVLIPELENITTKLVKKINYYGLVDVEFKKDPRDGVFKLIEINPRCWMQISFSERYGLDLSYMIYMYALGKKINESTEKKQKIKWIFMLQDFLASFYNIKNKELTIYDWLKSMISKKEYAIFSWDDPLPFVMLIFQALKFNVIQFYIYKYKIK